MHRYRPIFEEFPEITTVVHVHAPHLGAWSQSHRPLPINYVPGGGLGNELGVPNSNVTPREQNLPIFSPSSYLGVGQTRSLPLYRRENTFQELDNLTWTKGSHTFKIGADFRRRH